MWEEQSPGTGISRSLQRKDTSISRLYKPGTSPKEEEVCEGTHQDYRTGLKRGFLRQKSNASPAVGGTASYIPLLIVKLHLAAEEVEAVVHAEASASIVGKLRAHILGIWKRVKKD